MPKNSPLELSPAIAAYAAKLRGLDLPPAGGRIRGPGNEKSDSVRATIAETGEPIKVSNKERVVSAEQNKLLNAIAQGAGYKSLDAMFAAYGMPVGPVIKAGRRAAADGMAPEEVNKPGVPNPGRMESSIAAPPTLSAGGTFGRTEAAFTKPPEPRPWWAGVPTTDERTGLELEQERRAAAGALTSADPVQALVRHGVWGAADTTPPKPETVQNTTKPERRPPPSTVVTKPMSGLVISEKFNATPAQSRVVTAESAADAKGKDMQRSAGVFGTMDGAGVNGILERENKARAGMIDSMVEGNGGNGIGLLGVDQNGMTQTDRDNQEKTRRWRQDDLLAQAKGGNQAAGALASSLAQGDTQRDVELSRQGSVREGLALHARGQTLANAAEMAKLGLTARGQDLSAARDDQRIGIERSRLSLAETDQARAGEMFVLDKRIAEGHLADSEAVRAARTELSAALASGDPAKVAVAREKAIAAGVKVERPNNEFTAVTNPMGGTTILNKDTGAGAIYDVQGKKMVEIAPPKQYASLQQEYQAAIASVAGDQRKIAAINARAKELGVIK